MKIADESSLDGYLVKHLKPLTQADPTILAEYVVALLKKDKPTEELKKLCTDNLVDFLGHSTQSFIADLFEALEDGSLIKPVDTVDSVKKSEISVCPAAVDPLELKAVSSNEKENSHCKKEQDHSPSSEPTSEPEDQEISDEDDDRNHKHRKRDSQSLSFERDDKRQYLGRPNGRGKNFCGNRELLQQSHIPPNEIKREYNPSLGKDLLLKFEKKRPGMTVLHQASVDFGQRNRTNVVNRNDSGPRFELPGSLSRPPCGRGRGRGTGPWSQLDSRFMPLGSLDFTSHMASQVSAHPSIFMGTTMPTAANSQSAPWGAFGFVPGMPSMQLEPLHPIGLHGTLHSSVNSQLNLSMPCQRCRDFEEQGFCLRGDMCPMEHGVNRIVVEDVQSLSQFNLPVSLPSMHTPVLQAGSGILNPLASSLSPSTNIKSLPNKSGKIGVTDTGLESSEVLCSPTTGGEPDVYDPDQPLWNNDNPETSKSLSRFCPPRVGDTDPWDVGSSDIHGFKIPGSIASEELPSSSNDANISSQGMGQIGSEVKLKVNRRSETITSATVSLCNNFKENDEALTSTHSVLHHRKVTFTEEIKDMPSIPRFCKDARQNIFRTSQKASCTLFVSGIPQNSNKKNALLSHFERFGKVIDIYIPLNSEKAFVQFSRREQAEAALKAPDAVMGNRFIKLFWANRDNVVDEKGVAVATSVPGLPTPASLVPSRFSDIKGKEPLSSVDPKANDMASADATSHTIQPKVTVNTSKALCAQKKWESLELLKEELRRKQELLAKKRNEFRSQLDKLEKQAVSSHRLEPVSRKPSKRYKSEKDVEIAKAPIVEPLTCSPMRAQPEVERKLDQSISSHGLAFSNSKADSCMQFPKNSTQTNCPSVPSANRFKLDNRPTGFKILPPLPANFLNVAAIRDHFSPFHDLSTVELEDPETNSSHGCPKPSPNCCAYINFSTRRSAEKAFLAGKCWQGHTLQFAWLTASSNTNCHGSQQVSPRYTNPREVDVSGFHPENVVSESTLLSAGRSTCNITSKLDNMMSKSVNMIPKSADASDSTEQMDVDGAERLHKHLTASPSSPSISSAHQSPSEPAVLTLRDDIDAGSAK